jgi:hypothetical protein
MRDNEICTSDGQIDVYRDPIPYTTASTWRSCSNTVLFTAGKTCQKDTRYETTLILTKVKWLHRSWNKALFPRKWDFIQVSIGHFCHNCPLSLRELHTDLMVQIGPFTRHVENPFYRWWQRWWSLHHLHIPVSKTLIALMMCMKYIGDREKY